MAAFLDQLLDEIIAREGSKDTADPADSGGRTKYGISIRWHPEAWVDGPPTREQAKAIYLQQYLINTNIHHIVPDFLRNQVADFAVLSGPAIAIQHLQRLLNVTADGILGPVTLAALRDRSAESLNQALVVARVMSMVRLVQRRPKDLVWLWGWINRALSFLRM